MTQDDHDTNLNKFLEAAERKNMLQWNVLFQQKDWASWVMWWREERNIIENSVVCVTDKSLPFEMGTDASDVAIVAILSQAGCLVAFFSRTFQSPKKYYTSIKKEAQAIIEAVCHWQHYLDWKTFHHENSPAIC